MQDPPPPSDALARSASLIRAARVLLLVLAGGAAVFAFWVTRRAEQPASLPPTYACPMHHQVTANARGFCPICGMALEPVAQHHVGLASSREATGRLAPNEVDVVRRRITSHQVRAPAWVEANGSISALVYDDDVATLGPDERGIFRPTAASTSTSVVRTADEPPTSWDASTSKLEFCVASRTPVLAPGTTGWVELPRRASPTLVVPSSAVLQSADGPYVLAVAGRGGFIRRKVRVGKTLYGLATILSGLREDERIAVKAPFFLDAERRLAVGADSAGP